MPWKIVISVWHDKCRKMCYLVDDAENFLQEEEPLEVLISRGSDSHEKAIRRRLVFDQGLHR